MKDLVNKMKSFLVFDFPLQVDYIKSDFAAIHNKSLKELPEWSITATDKDKFPNTGLLMWPGILQ